MSNRQCPDGKSVVKVLLKMLKASSSCSRSVRSEKMYENAGFLKWVPQNEWFIRENPIKVDDLGLPLFQETTKGFPWPHLKTHCQTSTELGASSGHWLTSPRWHCKAEPRVCCIWWFPEMGVSQNGGFIREIPIKMDDLGGVPLF